MDSKDKAFYLVIWNSREHICQSCGAYLGKEPRSYMFDHLIEKKPHPELRHVAGNIFLVCLECHNRKGRGFPTARHQAAIDNAIKIFL